MQFLSIKKACSSDSCYRQMRRSVCQRFYRSLVFQTRKMVFGYVITPLICSRYRCESCHERSLYFVLHCLRKFRNDTNAVSNGMPETAHRFVSAYFFEHTRSRTLRTKWVQRDASGRKHNDARPPVRQEKLSHSVPTVTNINY